MGAVPLSVLNNLVTFFSTSLIFSCPHPARDAEASAQTLGQLGLSVSIASSSFVHGNVMIHDAWRLVVMPAILFMYHRAFRSR